MRTFLCLNFTSLNGLCSRFAIAPKNAAFSTKCLVQAALSASALSCALYLCTSTICVRSQGKSAYGKPLRDILPRSLLHYPSAVVQLVTMSLRDKGLLTLARKCWACRHSVSTSV